MPYDGSGQPVARFTPIDVRLRNGAVLNNVLAHDVNWQHVCHLPDNDIVEWRVHESALPGASTFVQMKDERLRGIGLLQAIVDDADNTGCDGVYVVAEHLIETARDFLREVKP